MMRNQALYWLRSLICPPMWVLVLGFIRFRQFAIQGLEMYPDLNLKVKMTIPQAMELFYGRSIEPLLWWFLIAGLVDYFIIQPLYHRHVINR
jgi:hypothetical protein